MMHRDKEEDERNVLTNKMRPVYCPVCGWKIMDAVCGTKTQAKIPRKGRYPDFIVKCGHCGTEIGITKTK